MVQNHESMDQCSSNTRTITLGVFMEIQMYKSEAKFWSGKSSSLVFPCFPYLYFLSFPPNCHLFPPISTDFHRFPPISTYFHLFPCEFYASVASIAPVFPCFPLFPECSPFPHMAVGQNQWYHVWCRGTTRFRTYFSGWIESDVHWGITDSAFDPWPYV